MASQNTKHTKTTTSEEKKTVLVSVVHFQGSAGKSYAYCCGCQRPENRLEKLQDICNWRRMKPADSPNQREDSFNQVPEKLKPEMVIIETVIGAFQNKILIA